MADKYNLTYRGVKCVEVDWGRELFTFIVNNKTIKYKQQHYIESSADTDHIRSVIDEYINSIIKNTLIQQGITPDNDIE